MNSNNIIEKKNISQQAEASQPVGAEKVYYRPINSTFDGGFNNCLSFLHHHVMAKIGSISYRMNIWKLFPQEKEQCKELAIKWAASFQKRPDFADKIVVIFFVIAAKIIKIEVKDKNQMDANQNANLNQPSWFLPDNLLSSPNNKIKENITLTINDGKSINVSKSIAAPIQSNAAVAPIQSNIQSNDNSEQNIITIRCGQIFRFECGSETCSCNNRKQINKQIMNQNINIESDVKPNQQFNVIKQYLQSGQSSAEPAHTVQTVKAVQVVQAVKEAQSSSKSEINPRYQNVYGFRGKKQMQDNSKSSNSSYKNALLKQEQSDD